MIGQLVGHYRVLEKIGSGGMGEVFRARDERLGRDVALKMIRPSSSENADHLRRFEQEARAAAALSHPNILAIYDVGFEGKTPYIVSELLQGKTLRERLAEGKLPLRETTSYAFQIANALVTAHERHIVHRDLKPENLFLVEDGQVKILDFGVAKLQLSHEDKQSIESLTTVTKSGAIVGTVAYMSPEQLRGKPVDHRTDIFSFGAILYEMMAGARAFRGETEVDTMTAVLREEPPIQSLDASAIPSSYQDILRHCLEKDADKRFQSARDLAFALQTLSGSPVTGRAPRSTTSRRSTPWPWVVTTMVAAIAVALLASQGFFRALPAQPSYRRLTFEAGTVYAARFSPNGNTIVYSAAWDGKPIQTFTTVGDSLLTQTLNLGTANLLAISPNNNLALVVGGTHSGQMETVDGVLATAPLAGGSPREILTQVRWADSDPHGNLAVVHNVEGHSRLEFPIDTVLYESRGWISNIRFSPDGRQIAFMDHPALWDNRGFVSVVDLSRHVRRLSQEWKSEGGLAWRPDGKEIWFTAVGTNDDLNLMAITLSGKERTVLDLPIGISLQDIAPDGRVLVALNSIRLAMAYKNPRGTEDPDLSWHDWNSVRDISADGQYVLFEDSSHAAGSGYSVVLRKVDGALPIRLGDGSSGSLSPDAKWAISTSTSQPNQLTLLPTGAGQSRTIMVAGVDHVQTGWARFFPDGQRALLNGDQTGHAPRCYVVNLSNGAATAATPEGVLCGPIAPDGRSVMGKGSAGIGVYPLDGSASRIIPSLGSNFVALQWSNDISTMYGYHTGELPSRVYKVDIATGKETVLQELRPGVPAGVVMVAPIVVSRDGKHIAYSYNQTLSSLYLISGLR